jgi:cytochrome P450
MSLGETVTLEQLETDPYPLYARLRDDEPVSWVPAAQLWLVTRYDDVRRVDLAPDVFTGATTPSTLNRTMGTNMLGSEGPTSSVSGGSRRHRSGRATSRNGCRA